MRALSYANDTSLRQSNRKYPIHRPEYDGNARDIQPHPSVTGESFLRTRALSTVPRGCKTVRLRGFSRTRKVRAPYLPLALGEFPIAFSTADRAPVQLTNGPLGRNVSWPQRCCCMLPIRSCGDRSVDLRGYSLVGRLRKIVRPSLHQDPTSIEQVRSRIGGLDLALHGMRQTRLGNLARLARLPAPIAE